MNKVVYSAIFDGGASIFGASRLFSSNSFLDQARHLCHNSNYGSVAFLKDSASYCNSSGNSRKVGLIAALVDELVVGVLLFQFLFDECEIEHIVVEKNYQRQGVALGMLQTLEEIGKTKDIRKIFLEVGVDNFGAKALYSKIGYVQISRRVRYYRDTEDALVLEKTL